MRHQITYIGGQVSNVTYTGIIDPQLYQDQIEQHVHIQPAKDYLVSLVRQGVESRGTDVLEAGVGPGVVTRRLGEIPGISLSALDRDKGFVIHANASLQQAGHQAIVQLRDVRELDETAAYHVIASVGMHHHIQSADRQRYLTNMRRALRPGGCYIVLDEFLTGYSHGSRGPSRAVMSVLWHAHVIQAAISTGAEALAVEEAKILLDDLVSADDHQNPKGGQPIDLVLSSVHDIDRLTRSGSMSQAYGAATRFIGKLGALPRIPTGDPSVDAHRGDYKVSGREFRTEVHAAGFRVVSEATRHFGPIDVCGGISVYLLIAAD